MSSTLIFSHDDIVALLDPTELFDQISDGFAELADSGETYRGRRFPIHLPHSEQDASGMVLAPGLHPSIPAYTVKVNSKFPHQRPGIKGLIVMHSLNDGTIMALFDSGFLTSARTAASGAVGADALSRPDCETVAIIGCGVQGKSQLEWMLKIRPIRSVYLYDIERSNAEALAKHVREDLGLTVDICRGAKSAAMLGDIVVTATWADQPILQSGDVREGTHITTLGADGPGESELAADLLRQSRFFADDAELQVEMGAIGGAGLDRSDITAEIGEVLVSRKSGRDSARDITVYGMVGLPFQDLVAAWIVYQKSADSRCRDGNKAFQRVNIS